MRWNLVPAVFFGFVGVVSLLGGIFIALVIIYYNVRLGARIEQAASHDALAFSTRNIARVLVFILAGVCALFAAQKWYQRRYRFAAVLTLFLWMMAALVEGFLK